MRVYMHIYEKNFINIEFRLTQMFAEFQIQI